MAISPARLAAFDILLRIDSGDGYSSELLAAVADSLDERDRGLCYELTLGVLRRQLYLDRAVDALSGARRLDPEVRSALRIGLYQLVFLDRVPAYSAINDSVELVKRAKKRSAAGFVNAILRRASRDTSEIVFADDIDQICVESSHPRWLVEKWIDSFGLEMAERVAFANNELPKVAFRLTRLGFADEHPELKDVLDREAFPSDTVDGCFIAERFSPALRRLESDGLIYFQDEASQLVANVAASFEGNSLLDVCASPGGKTTQIAARLGSDVLIAAGDISRPRVELLERNSRSQGAANVNIVQYDAESGLPFPAGSFDTVLLDAPCSGTGTIRHNPEIRYRLPPADLSRYARRQFSILRNAAEVVALNGRLIYSTCSLEPEENEDVVGSFLAEDVRFELLRPPVADEFVTEDLFARTYPSRDNMDGFFIAVLQRTGKGG